MPLCSSPPATQPDSTIAKRSGFAKQFFANAVKQELIPRSPFAGLKSSAKPIEPGVG